jgi:hypothetical protein
VRQGKEVQRVRLQAAPARESVSRLSFASTDSIAIASTIPPPAMSTPPMTAKNDPREENAPATGRPRRVSRSHHGLQGRPCDDGGLQKSKLSKSCGSGLVFVVLPCVSSMVVSPTPAWFFPGPSKVVQVTCPWTFVQFSGSGAAPAPDMPNTETAAKHAGTTAIAITRLIKALAPSIERPKTLVIGAGPVSQLARPGLSDRNDAQRSLPPCSGDRLRISIHSSSAPASSGAMPGMDARCSWWRLPSPTPALDYLGRMSIRHSHRLPVLGSPRSPRSRTERRGRPATLRAATSA